jgi:hypothetical protein
MRMVELSPDHGACARHPDDGFLCLDVGYLAVGFSASPVPLMAWVRFSSLCLMRSSGVGWVSMISRRPPFGVVSHLGPPSLHVSRYLANALLLRRDTR